MNYHNITHDDMNNGDGLRVVLWVAGCEHHCKDCQNHVTWNPEDGVPFGLKDEDELFKALEQEYIAGITFSGGDPMHPVNRAAVKVLMKSVKQNFPGKTIWVYTGYTWAEVMDNPEMADMMKFVDVLVDGKFVADLLDVNYPWAGSTNQQVIDVQKSLKEGRVILHESH